MGGLVLSGEGVPRTDLPLAETDIRPNELRAGQAERLAADLRLLLARRAEFVAVACPACASDERQTEFEKATLNYVTCAACETLYMSPRPTPELLADYHASSENYAYWAEKIFPASEQMRRTAIFRPRAERVAELCARFGVATRTLVDVGAGFGTFCEEVRDLGLFERVVAVEPTPQLAETCRNRGLEVIAEPIEDVTLPPESVDVFTSFEVIEHLFAPRVLVETCALLLSPGGLLVLTCPNSKGFDVLTLGEHSSVIDNEHLNYFNPESLTRLVADCGLEVLQVTTPGRLDAELVRKNSVAGGIKLDPFLELVLVERWQELGGPFQRFLAEHRLSSHMCLVARRHAA